MAPFLPLEVILSVAEHSDSIGTVAAIAQASQGLARILLPVLYARATAEQESSGHPTGRCDGTSVLQWAAQHGRLGTLKMALDAGASDLGAALFLASSHGRESVVRILLERIDQKAEEARRVVLESSELGEPRSGPTDREEAEEPAELPEQQYYFTTSHNDEETRLEQLEQIDTERQKTVDWVQHGYLDSSHEFEAQLLEDYSYGYEGPEATTSPLAAAATRGDEVVCKLLLEAGADANMAIIVKPLYRAALHGHESICTLLLAYGADPANVAFGRCILTWAVESGRESLVRLIAEAPRPLDDFGPPFRPGTFSTPLIVAAELNHESIARYLVQSGEVEVETDNNVDNLALCAAIRNGNESLARFLIDVGKAEPGISDYDISLGPVIGSALFRVLERNQVSLFRYLVKSGKFHIHCRTPDMGLLPLFRAAGRGQVEIFQILVDAGADADPKAIDDRGVSLLSHAAFGGSETIVRRLVEAGLDGIPDGGDEAPLHWAARGGNEVVVKILIDTWRFPLGGIDEADQSVLFRAAEGGHLAVVRLLLHYHEFLYQIDKPNIHGETPLFIAAARGNAAFERHKPRGNDKEELGRYEAICHLLLDSGEVRCNVSDQMGIRVLHQAALRMPLSVVARLLTYPEVQQEVNIVSQNLPSSTALTLAAGEGRVDVVRHFLNAGLGLDLNAGRRPALVASVLSGSLATVQLLLDADDVNVNAHSCEDHGETATHTLTRVEDQSTSCAMGRLLLRTAGADVDAKDRSDQTPLFRAVDINAHRSDNRGFDLIRLFLDHGASIHAATWDGETPLGVAIKQGNMSIARLLLDHAKVVDLESDVMLRAALDKAIEDAWKPGRNKLNRLVRELQARLRESEREA